MKTYRVGSFEMLSQNLFHGTYWDPEEGVEAVLRNSEKFLGPTDPGGLPNFLSALKRDGIDPQGWRTPTMLELKVLGELFLLGVGGLCPPHCEWGYWSSTELEDTRDRHFFGLELRATGSPQVLEFWRETGICRIRPVRSLPHP